ncbi:unnamed protein product [Rhizopus stolonifer]
MPNKWTSLLAGVGLATLFTSQTRVQCNLLLNEPVRRISLVRTLTPLERSVDDSIFYYERRLVPSVKASWNAQVAQVALVIIEFDLPTRTAKFVLRNVFGHDS